MPCVIIEAGHLCDEDVWGEAGGRVCCMPYSKQWHVQHWSLSPLSL